MGAAGIGVVVLAYLLASTSASLVFSLLFFLATFGAWAELHVLPSLWLTSGLIIVPTALLPFVVFFIVARLAHLRAAAWYILGGILAGVVTYGCYVGALGGMSGNREIAPLIAEAFAKIAFDAAILMCLPGAFGGLVFWYSARRLARMTA